MNTARFIVLSSLCAAVLASTALAVAVQSRIVKVAIQGEPSPGSDSFVNNLQHRRLDKFIYDDGMTSLRCDVDWEAPADTWIVLEYRMPKSLESRGLRASSSGGAGSSAFFLQVPRGTPGDQIAWRARIVRGEDVLTERKSTLWR